MPAFASAYRGPDAAEELTAYDRVRFGKPPTRDELIEVPWRTWPEVFDEAGLDEQSVAGS